MALVVLLRGVNVGGSRTFRPSMLAEQLKYLDVVNIGAAGSFVIRRPVSRAQVKSEFARRLPFDAQIMICRGSEIAGLMSRDFFANQVVRPDIVRFVSVLAQSPRVAPTTPVTLPSSGQWLVKILAREGRFVVGSVPAAHGGHRATRQAGSAFRSARNHSQLEHHHRDREGARFLSRSRPRTSETATRAAEPKLLRGPWRARQIVRTITATTTHGCMSS